MHPSEVTSSVVGPCVSSYMDNPGVGLRPQFPVERKWALGLQVQCLHVNCFRTGTRFNLAYLMLTKKQKKNLAYLIDATITSDDLAIAIREQIIAGCFYFSKSVLLSYGSFDC